jgi:hypothetical protein
MIRSTRRNHPSANIRHAVAAIVYIAFAIYLYQPYVPTFQQWRWLIPLNAVIGAFGAYVLSRRWVAGLAGSCLAGAVYGFGPFMLGLARCHPSAGVLVGTIPWLCVPAVLLGRHRRSILLLPLWLLPLAAVVLYFWMCAALRLFVAPVRCVPQPGDIVGFIAPLVTVDWSSVVVGVYHVAIAPLILGCAVMVTARRYSLFFLLAAGLILSFSHSLLPPAQSAWLGACPVLWLSIPMVSLAILAAVGLQGLIAAGFADRKWVLIAAIGQALPAILMLLLATKYSSTPLFVEEAKMYLLGMMATGMVFLMAYRQLRLQWLRWLILCTALTLDIFLSARYLVDKVL